ncbi:NAD(P)H-binding protein [Halostella sp. JP-L12]|uniref:SDR family oxidoreductase n=1 Tax=Halostella TaxID=1843185 RepID=UPI000EF77CE7|nr:MULTISPECIES: NAD(P)H-binding protein [Halostella]NHN47254.1 NAD(P)H-binding protein [Halostella sp. JP-L12]
MVRTLLTGATGRLGAALRPRLADAGHDVRAASRSPPAEDEAEWVELDLAAGTGVEAAVEGVDVVVHAATAPQGDSEAVDVRGTERLLSAAADAGVGNVLYVSIVGVDEIPFSYYEHKLAAERAVESADVPTTILRATQFHGFVDDLLGSLSRLPVWPLPTRFRVQPIDVGEVADAVVERATPTAGGRASLVGGPEVLTLREIAAAYRDARGLRRPIVRLPVPGRVAGGFRAGHATCPDRTVGTVTWERWLAERYGDADATSRPSASPT